MQQCFFVPFPLLFLDFILYSTVLAQIQKVYIFLTHTTLADTPDLMLKLWIPLPSLLTVMTIIFPVAYV